MSETKKHSMPEYVRPQKVQITIRFDFILKIAIFLNKNNLFCKKNGKIYHFLANFFCFSLILYIDVLFSIFKVIGKFTKLPITFDFMSGFNNIIIVN